MFNVEVIVYVPAFNIWPSTKLYPIIPSDVLPSIGSIAKALSWSIDNG